MPTILELIRAEKQAQDDEEARPPIRDVEAGRALIMDTKPEPSVNIALEMCVLRIEEFDKMYRIELIDQELEAEGEALLKTFDTLDLARRCKFVFQLTIWKSHKSELNRLGFRRGFSYRFEKVHSLRLLYGNPAGSMQIRQLLRAEPLTNAGEGDTGTGTSSLRGIQGDPSHVSRCDDLPSTPTQEGQHHAASGPSAGSDAIPVAVTPVLKTSGKRKGSKDDGDEVAPKKKRRSSAKVLSFDSPAKPAIAGEAS